MAKFPDDDYFANTTMTFGEHLEELRGALLKAIIALAIGFFAGLGVSEYVVRFIQTPLERALKRYYLDVEMDRLRAEGGEQAVAEMEELLAKNAFIREHDLGFSFHYFERDQLLRALGIAEGAEPSETAEHATSTRHARRSAKNNTDDTTLVASSTANVPDSGEPNFVRLRVWLPTRVKITALSAQEAFMIWLKAAFITGVIIASPIMFYYIWNFVAAGLYPHEKKYVHLYLPFSIGLFLLGASMAFFFVFDPVLDFLFSFNSSMKIDPDPRISEWIGFVLMLPIGFGIAFQLPLVMLFINRIGIIELSTFIEKWRIAILAIFVISMVLTPADPVSMLMMALPLTVLYFIGVLLCLWMPRSNNPFAEAEPT